MKQRILSLLLVVLTFIALCSPALAAEPTSGQCGKNVTWKLDVNGSANGHKTYTLTISGKGRMYDYGGYDQPWYTFSRYITHAIVQEGVTSIGELAFYECEALKDVTLSDSLSSIEKEAFECCYSLTTIEIPNSVNYIGNYAFVDCTKLKSAKLPSHLTELNFGVFRNCYSLADITIPTSVTLVDGMAFYNCRNLTCIVLPKNVTWVGEDALGGCQDLLTITVVNPDCQFYFGGTSFGERGVTTVIGHPGSPAEELAQDCRFKFQPIDTAKNGIVTEGENQYFYVDGVRQTGLVVSQNGKMYYCAGDGHIIKGGVVKSGGKAYYASADDGHFLKSSWVLVNGIRKYFAGADGVLYTEYKTIGTKSYYFSVKDCHLMKGGLVTGPGNKQYYVSAKDGHAMKGGWAQGQAVKGRTGYSYYYYLDTAGVVRVTRQLPSTTKPASIPAPRPSEYQN